MIGLLFDTQYWYDLIAVAVILILVILFCKYKDARYGIAGLVSVFILILTVFCAVQINNYYSVEGGIWGKLSTIITNNQIEQTEEAKFSLQNIVLTEDVNGEFSAIIVSDKKLSLENTKGKWLFVNNIPCTDCQLGIDGISAKYKYTFAGSDFEELHSDILKIDFSFYEKGYRLKLTTEGGQTAVNYWNTYFSRNNFVVSVEDFKIETSKDVSILENEEAEVMKLTYYVDEEIFAEVIYPKNVILTSFIEPAKEEYLFFGWSLDGKTSINNLTMDTDKKLYALFEKEYLYDGPGQYSIEFSELDTEYVIDLKDHFDFNFTDNIVIELSLFAYKEDNDYVTWIDNICPGQSLDCIRNTGLHWASVSLLDDGILKISKGPDVEHLYNIQVGILCIKTVKV